MLSTATYILGFVQMVFAVLLIIIVLLQSGRSANMSAITGQSDSYMGKNSKRSKEAMLTKATTFLAIVFIVLTVAILFMTR